ncbi:MAG: GAF domain-containing protein [Cytophagales bacterium]|nr:MAG: GAF domain-containing protein [Cytophagales bacterium]
MQPAPDLTNCEREPIQWPGYIQSHGYLIALDVQLLSIVQVSENCGNLTGQSANALIGRSINELTIGDLPGSVLHNVLTVALRSGKPELLNPYRVDIQGNTWQLLVHQHDNALIVELEPAQTDAPSEALSTQSLLSQTMSDIQRSASLSDLLTRIAPTLKQLLGFDRVMVYRFGDDWHGEVVAEAREDHLVPFLGMHYPASDIPKQARELYKINLVRSVVDVREPRVAIVPVNHPQHNRPLNLTYAQLRSVSPVHIEYLQNMGVRASMSISLLNRGELWGLIACHHYEDARQIDYTTRQSAVLISQVLSSAIEIRESDETAQYKASLLAHEQTLYEQMLTDWDVAQGLTKHSTTLLDITTATGAALLFEGQLHTMGNTPTPDDITALVDWLRTTTTERVFQTNQLPNLYHPAELFRQTASGVLMVVLSREMNEFMLWFKPEQIHSVSWGGNPEKPVEMSETGEVRLSPRKSFDKWTEEVRNRALPWRQEEVATTLKLREDLLQLVAQKANQIRALNEQLRLAQEELEAFSYTVSHDLRSPLSSIKSYTEIFLEDYGHTLPHDALPILDKVVKATDRMSLLIRNLMDYSRTSRNEVNMERLSMQPVLIQLRDELLADAIGRKLTIRVGNTPDVYGDQSMVSQVFSNLLANAVKYTQAVPQARVTIDGHGNGTEVIYAVTDNGIGIDMKQAGKVFELFQRLDSATTYEGYGVGLAIVKRIMGRHRGKVWFESNPHQSTTFYVSFPSHLS